MSLSRRPLIALLSAVLLGTLLPACAAPPQQADYSSRLHDFRLVTLAQGLDHPWGMAFLPDGDLLVTERAGRLRIVRDGQLLPQPVTGVPEVAARGQGGLLDVALHPAFADNRLVYLSYAGEGTGGAGTEVARGRLEEGALTDLEVIFRASPKTPGNGHYGGRLQFLADGTLIITLGDRQHYMHEAQNLTSHLGSLIRVNDDGSVPADNPFVDQPNALPEIWSYGHRNVQGLALDTTDGTLWTHEHGPRGGDEVNLIRPGRNYGWPTITYGINYSGTIISERTEAPGMEQPAVYWDPSIAPSGMAVYQGERFAQWQGNLFVGALKFRHLRRLELDGNRVVGQEILLEDFGERIREVESGPDGYLYLLTDSGDGRLLRLEPVPGNS